MGAPQGVQGTAGAGGAQGSPVPQRTPADMEAQRNIMLQQLGSRGAMQPGAGPAGPTGTPGGGMPGGKGAGGAGRTSNMLMGLKQRPMANAAAGISPPGTGLTA